MKDINVKALVGAFNQEKVIVGAFSMIVKTLRKLVSSSRGAATFLMSPISLNVENIHLSSAAIKAGRCGEVGNSFLIGSNTQLENFYIIQRMVKCLPQVQFILLGTY